MNQKFRTLPLEGRIIIVTQRDVQKKKKKAWLKINEKRSVVPGLRLVRVFKNKTPLNIILEFHY